MASLFGLDGGSRFPAWNRNERGAPATVCMVCSVFKKGRCKAGKGNCTAEQGPGCRTRDIFYFNIRDGWGYNHTQLDCYDDCKSWKLIRGNLKVSSFCCEGQDFCNKYKGRSQKWKPR
ncbi:acrosomal protein SP-10-like [Felis catus]|uniref:Prostate and testis expressed 2 n=1 Tax=Felis catus TaxID=9685 RepID=A0ABI7Y1J3_FELCA|nr:acrosomal protein SP-10-like [Felis catus]